MNELKNLQSFSLTTMGIAVKQAFDVLNINRMTTGIDTYGQGRCPFYLETAVIVLITDGGRLTTGLLHFCQYFILFHLSIPKDFAINPSFSKLIFQLLSYQIGCSK